jgi:hypothetical protein
MRRKTRQRNSNKKLGMEIAEAHAQILCENEKRSRKFFLHRIFC